MTASVLVRRPRPTLLPLALFAAGVLSAPAAADTGFHRDRTPLPPGVTGGAGAAVHASVQTGGSTGGAALRMLLGLGIVLLVIFGLYKLLKRTADRNDKSVRSDGFMDVVASTQVAPSRSLHLVRVGDELVLVGASEQSVTRIRVYSPEQARRLGVDPEGRPMLPLGSGENGRPGFGAALIESLRKMTAR